MRIAHQRAQRHAHASLADGPAGVLDQRVNLALRRVALQQHAAVLDAPLDRPRHAALPEPRAAEPEVHREDVRSLDQLGLDKEGVVFRERRVGVDGRRLYRKAAVLEAAGLRRRVVEDHAGQRRQ